MEKPRNWARTGTFSIGHNQEVAGELTLDGSATILRLYSEKYFFVDTVSGQCIHGVLHDGTNVSLLNSITKLGTGWPPEDRNRRSRAEIFPHIVAYGARHLSPEDKTIAAVEFVIDDASTLFYDFDAFGTLSDARPFIDSILQASSEEIAKHFPGHERKIAAGPDPQIQYFIGKREIFSADTVIGKVSASHRPTQSLGGPTGVGMTNRIVVTIEYANPKMVDDTICDVRLLARYFEILVGRPPNLLSLVFRCSGPDGQHALGVYCSYPPRRSGEYEEITPAPAEVLVDSVHNPSAFATVLSKWVARETEWKASRQRFHGCFSKQQFYDPDRVIGAANMFDLLPAAALPDTSAVSPDLVKAAVECETLFRPLPDTPGRASVLNALDRLGGHNLKNKIRYRAAPIISAIGEKKFPELPFVTDQAVECRNHYVHGSPKPKLDYEAHLGKVLPFFVDTLEFVFAASDLMECGWDIAEWAERPTSMAHPFASYLVRYGERLNMLKDLVAQQKATRSAT